MEQKEIKEKLREEFEIKVFDIRLVGNKIPLNSPRNKATSKMMTVKEWNSKIEAVEYCDSDNNPLLVSKEEFMIQCGRVAYSWIKNMRWSV